MILRLSFEKLDLVFMSLIINFFFSTGSKQLLFYSLVNKLTHKSFSFSFPLALVTLLL